MMLGFLLIAVVCARKAFVSDYYQAAQSSTGVDFSKYGIEMKMEVYTVIENGTCTYTGGELNGFSVGDFYFNENVKAITMTANNKNGVLSFIVKTFSDDKCAKQLQTTHELTET